MAVTFKFLVGANGTFCVFFRAGGKDGKRPHERALSHTAGEVSSL